MPMRQLSLRQLQVVRTVAELGSMARAARAMHMTGPAVTQQVQQLEKSLGAPVLDRLGRRLRLTLVGERDDGTLHLGILATAFRDYLLDEGARKVATETRLPLTAEPGPP